MKTQSWFIWLIKQGKCPMLQIRKNFYIEVVANQQINIHVELVNFKINICAISCLSKISLLSPTLEAQMNRKITSTLSTALKYKLSQEEIYETCSAFFYNCNFLNIWFPHLFLFYCTLSSQTISNGDKYSNVCLKL